MHCGECALSDHELPFRSEDIDADVEYSARAVHTVVTGGELLVDSELAERAYQCAQTILANECPLWVVGKRDGKLHGRSGPYIRHHRTNKV